MSNYTFCRDVGPNDWPALPRVFKKGERVQRFTGHDYGLVRDDLLLGGWETVACTIDGGETMFTVKCELLLDDGGKHPPCEYVIVR